MDPRESCLERTHVPRDRDRESADRILAHGNDGGRCNSGRDRVEDVGSDVDREDNRCHPHRDRSRDEDDRSREVAEEEEDGGCFVDDEAGDLSVGMEVGVSVVDVYDC